MHLLIQILLLLGRQSHVSSLAPYFLWTKDLDTTTTALYLVLSLIGFTTGSIIAGYIIQRTKQYKALCMVSLTFGALVYLAIAIRWGNEPYPWEYLYILPAGMAPGAVLACTFTALTMSTPKPLQATAICIYYLCQQIGGIIGTGMSSVTLHTIFKNTLEDRLGGIPNKEEVIRGILNDSSSLSVPEALRNVVHSSYRYSFQCVAFLPCLTAGLTLPFIFLALKVKANLRFGSRKGDPGS